MNLKNNLVLLLKSMNLVNQILMRSIIYSMVPLGIVEVKIFIHFNIDVLMIINS